VAAVFYASAAISLSTSAKGLKTISPYGKNAEVRRSSHTYRSRGRQGVCLRSTPAEVARYRPDAVWDEKAWGRRT